MLFGARHGRSSEEANFSTLPELGQAEMVPWKPNKAGEEAQAGAHLSTRMLGKGAALAARESFRAFEVLPVRLSLARGTVWPP